MRTLIILTLVAIALAVVRWLINDVVRAVKRSLAGSTGFREGSEQARNRKGSARSETASGHLVRDPVSGTYIDERLAFKQTIDGKTFYFETKENRDSYLKKTRSG